jgi:hypothetical protein
LADFFRTGVAELDAGELAALERHLAECPDCRALFRAERQHDKRLARMFQSVAVPTAAKDRTIARLLAARRAWWRHRILAAAAALVVLIGATAAIHLLRRPTFDPNAIAVAAYEQSGWWRTPEEARMLVDRWLRGFDSRLSAPPEWNYRYVSFLGRSDFEGLASVPTLFLIRGNAMARIYVVRTSAFRNLEAFDQPVEEGGWIVAVRRYPELPGWAFIAVVGGGPLELFLQPAPPRDPA